MAKLKKHQLLEKAMRDYPAGTRFTSYSEKFEFSYTSTGLFVCWKDKYNTAAHKDSIWRVNEQGEPSGMVYNGLNKEWAEVVKPSILTGKCAIQVNNEREFKLLMQHYEANGWKWKGFESPVNPIFIPNSFPDFVRYKNFFTHTRSVGFDEKEGYTIIPFDKFAKEVGIEVPVFVMTSEDNVPLYEGDDYHRAWYNETSKKWHVDYCYSLSQIHTVITNTATAKAFATKEAAEAWIREQNRPRTVEVKLFKGGTANVYHDHICLHGGVVLKPSDLEDMLHAYKSLQS